LETNDTTTTTATTTVIYSPSGVDYVTKDVNGGSELYQTPGTASVPEPMTMSLMGAGLLGLGFFGRRKFGRK
jgi:hypothetical protein